MGVLFFEFEDLEFKGDARLYYGVPEIVRGYFPGINTHGLTHVRQVLVRNEVFGALAVMLGLQDELLIDGVKVVEPRMKRMGDCFEAYVGALWQECEMICDPLQKVARQSSIEHWQRRVFSPDVFPLLRETERTILGLEVERAFKPCKAVQDLYPTADFLKMIHHILYPASSPPSLQYIESKTEDTSPVLEKGTQHKKQRDGPLSTRQLCDRIRTKDKINKKKCKLVEWHLRPHQPFKTQKPEPKRKKKTKQKQMQKQTKTAQGAVEMSPSLITAAAFLKPSVQSPAVTCSESVAAVQLTEKDCHLVQPVDHPR